jgi:hypothetical protein
MAIRYACPSCRQEVSAPEELAGKQARCPKCAAVFVLPSLDEPVPVAPHRPRDDYRSDERPRDDYRPEPRRRTPRFRCPYCDSDEMPRVSEEISTGGWVVFVVLCFVCIPLCWIPLISMKEQKRYCFDCGMKLG